MGRELGLACLLPLLATCAGAAPKEAAAPTAALLDEKRAIAVIASAVEEQHETPAEGREIRLRSGKVLWVDVGAMGRRFGIAYLTPADLRALEVAVDLPPRAHDGDLWITQGAGPDADVVVLLLDAAEYSSGGTLGPEHERSALKAEGRLARDVRDFLAIAHERRMP